MLLEYLVKQYDLSVSTSESFLKSSETIYIYVIVYLSIVNKLKMININTDFNEQIYSAPSSLLIRRTGT